ncbi:hypothetical protein AQZ52_10820 [Novosphingobium fuchskuhlense]|uniref:Uncharacterized protein n=1 Tax=Novosphingobium fuchskuhlense TaxID=1117702 RepID=A0A117UUL1_9SPHN|nr:hypothetical protein [Novosphingobium fuchskuhlense]KUR71156.1 hypothetical protein AQZ52_10820 [Novosphingobium fuchskuhlense]
MTPMTDDLDKLARGLTAAQRKALLSAWATALGFLPSVEGECRLSTLKGLERRRLVSQTSFCLTPLGQRLKAHIERTGDGIQ